ncbi:MAG: pyridoxal phosphate-dependent aminotransferase family protein [Anaerolineales bacterium]|nr:pyridoxal phosphate-dependent aminotransferase family protein [Anaerolineales bacterium]MCS7247385.1 pyridoxal phosphate-dependent aminotransferase family protein [Anaerolineales bacterium]MDW8161196.1 pyridoxal phosphate-dependent aminotransferase family protein [Anaerolineales bacterium]MDW8446275.1 pyridoxal phosphate-dependent aminotransferase family protein [Anaerolineales bacterium]
MDIFEKCAQFTIVREAVAGGYYPYFIPLSENEGSEVMYGNHRLIMCGSNNYLGLTTHPKVKEAAIEAIRRYGTSCTGSRFLNGNLELHERLEQELAEWVGKPAALVFSTGMQTNLGTISALVDRSDVVILDKYDHASIVDGARLAWGETKRFRHNDMQDLERVLKSIPEEKGKLVVVDGVYSMEGDIAPLPELIELCRRYGARLMVDDAHSLGVLGGGKGTAAHFGVTEGVDLIMSTFSKSFASLGGFIAGEEQVIEYIQHHARALIFSASIPPANAAAALAALEVMRQEPERIARVNAIGERVRTELKRMGYQVGNSQTPIVPIIIGDDMRTVFAWKALFEAGLFVNPVLSPAVPAGRQLLRTSYMATHTDEQIDRALELFEKVGKQIGLI